MTMYRLIVGLCLFIVLGVSNVISQTIPAKKIGEVQGSNLVITHSIEDLKQAIIQEIGDCDIITEVSIEINNGFYFLSASGYHGENSINFIATMYENNGDIFMSRFEMNATKESCKGVNCSKCVATFENASIDSCTCERGPGFCEKTTESSLSPGSMGYVERFLAY